MFVRFVVPYRHPGSEPQRSVLAELHRLEEEGELLSHEADRFRESENWLARHLPRADAPEEAVRWLRVTASEPVSCMRALAAILETRGIPVQEMLTNNPGEIVYEDDHQVAAVPFSRDSGG